MNPRLVCTGPGEPSRGLHVLVVDDSAHSRRTLRAVLEELPEVETLETAGNGRLALETASKRPPDLVVLDLNMPVMNGFTFLRLFRTRSAAPILVVSSRSNLSSVDKALELGATGFLSKPEDPYRDLPSIGEELRLKVREIARRRGLRTAESLKPSRIMPAAGAGFPVIVIGASSGGPPTLQYLLSSLPMAPCAAVLIAQHMPEGFTQGLATRLAALLSLDVREGRHGDVVVPGGIFVAPGGKHMVVNRSEVAGAEATLSIEDADGDLSSPSVDRLLASVAEAFGSRVTAIVLTGMGRDGADGVRAVKARGGHCIAESEETAAVFGMPREAAATGCVDEVLPIPAIAVRLMRLCGPESENSRQVVSPPPFPRLHPVEHSRT